MKNRTFLLIIFFLGFLTYAGALFNGFVGDDELQIVRNIQVHSLSNFSRFFTSGTYETAGNAYTTGFYRPIMSLTYSLLYALAGPSPLFFHLFQLLLQIINTVLLFYFLKKLFPVNTAFICALIFLIHPLNVEAVVYSANMQETLYFLFGITVLIILQKTDGKRGIIPALLVLLLSLFSKESGILFLAISFVYCLLFQKDKSRLIILSVGIFVVFSTYLIFRFLLAGIGFDNVSIAPITHAPLPIRLMNIPAIMFYYFRTFLVPVKLAAMQFWIIRKVTFTNFYLPLVFDLVFLAILLWGYRLTKKYHHNLNNTYLFFYIWFILGMLLHIQLLPLDATVADRWFYFPMVGLVCMIFLLIKPPVKILAVILCIFITLSITRVLQWKDELTLYGHDIQVTPRNFILDNTYATALIKDARFETAQKYLIASITEHPYAANLNNMAIVYAAEKNTTKAEEYFQAAISKSDNFSVSENYANFLLYYKNPASASEFAGQELVKFPDSPGLWLTLGKAEYLLGATPAAIVSVKKSYLINQSEDTAEIHDLMQKGTPLPKLDL